jgi:hypothetical protein
MNIGTKLTATGAFDHLATLDEVVDTFLKIRTDRFGEEHHDAVVRFTLKAPSLEEAVRRACAGRREDGLMFQKGSCVRTVSREDLSRSLLSPINLSALREAKTFEDVYDAVKAETPWGVGPMTVYNVAERIGAWLGIYPAEFLYLHAGPMSGWRRLTGLKETRDRVPIEEVPGPLRRLKVYDIEDALCEMRDLLHPGMLTQGC